MNNLNQDLNIIIFSVLMFINKNSVLKPTRIKFFFNKIGNFASLNFSILLNMRALMRAMLHQTHD